MGRITLEVTRKLETLETTHTERFNRRTKRQQALTGNNTVPAAQMDETAQDVDGQRSEMDEAARPDVAAQRSRG